MQTKNSNNASPVDYFSIIHQYIKPESKTYRLYIPHVVMVTQKALRIGKALDLPAADLQFIEEAAMLHDIGIVMVKSEKLATTGELPYVCHGTKGREILEAAGLPQHALVAERHTGVGITLEEIVARDLPLPRRSMVPESLPEKIICYADLFFSKRPEQLWYEESAAAIEAELAEFGQAQVTAFKKLHTDFKV